MDYGEFSIPSRNVLVKPFRDALYSPVELFEGFDPENPRSYENTLDFRVYRHFVKAGRLTRAPYIESIIQSLHDNSVAQTLNSFLAGKRVAAIMGGHKLKRDSGPYTNVVRVAKALTESGFVVASGGGPGAMEACHLGAFCAGAPEERVVEAISKLKEVPELPANLASIVNNEGDIDYSILEKLYAWQRPAFELTAERAPSADSLAVPTWHYGHEPPTPFASHLAKYFQNSLREDGLLAIAKHGIIFVEGRAGTLQEIFQDAAQNYYQSFDWFSPMVFLGKDYWTDELPVVGTLKTLFPPDSFDRHVKVTDSVDEARGFIESFEPPAEHAT